MKTTEQLKILKQRRLSLLVFAENVIENAYDSYNIRTFQEVIERELTLQDLKAPSSLFADISIQLHPLSGYEESILKKLLTSFQRKIKTDPNFYLTNTPDWIIYETLLRNGGLKNIIENSVELLHSKKKN